MLSITKYPEAMDALQEGRLAMCLKALVVDGVDHEKALALMAPPVQPKVGDVLVSSWGYEQTNIDYYQVVSVTAKNVKIQKMSKTYLPAQGTDRTTVDSVCGTRDLGAKIMQKKVFVNPLSGRYHVAIASYANAYGPHDVTVPCSETGWGYGH